ncbi:Peptidyl-prolyl cis-trans isomerase Pin1 [Vitis vinifera]|uniref:Peptidyl-prolyl cis-trans isomerase n=1 Tax=Vitis vinifera TaxID=29760 RepID=A0A438EUW9_VITVI|nr:Peptidyl-prolyl cis-trans isomerase Pin1 [Vitis vinifera]RVX16695.1 Peptidyl-prolyl cis-trans isomerase Pin1 [Vitis vinifera]
MSSNQVRASHILIKHQDSRRKASWRDPEGRVIKATTKESAVTQIKAIRDDIISGKSKFSDVASQISDCSSAKRGGDLGRCYESEIRVSVAELKTSPNLLTL